MQNVLDFYKSFYYRHYLLSLSYYGNSLDYILLLPFSDREIFFIFCSQSKNHLVFFLFVLEVHSGPYVYHRRVIWARITLICSIHISYFSLWLLRKYTEDYSSEYNKNYYYHQSWLIVDHHSYLMLLHFVTWFNNELSYITFMIIFLFVLYLCRPYTASPLCVELITTTSVPIQLLTY
jgi:hypothetical protein